MAIPGRAWIPLLTMLALCGCNGHYASPDGRDHPYVQAAIEESPPTLQDAATATYWGGQARQITLIEGAYAVGTAFLGNTVDVQAVTIDQRRIVVDLRRGDVGNTPERRRVIYELRRGALDQVSDTAR